MDDEGSQRLLWKAQRGIAEPATAEVEKLCRLVLAQRQPMAYSEEPTAPIRGCAGPAPAFWAGAPLLLPDTDACVGVLIVLDQAPFPLTLEPPASIH